MIIPTENAAPDWVPLRELLEQGATAARDAALAEIRAEFHETYGAFWKCADCGRYLGPACSTELPDAFEGTKQPDVCEDHPQSPVRLLGYAAP